MTPVQALLIALFVAAVESRALGYATLTLRFSPLMCGCVVGAVLGDMQTAMVTTAAIQLIYMGVVAPGGALPAEPCIAAAVAVSSAVIGELDATSAVAIAVPVGLLGSYLYQFRFFLNTIAVSKMDEYAMKADSKRLQIWIGLVPTLISFAIFVPMMFIALYAGAPVVASFVSSLEGGPVTHVLSVVGGGLAALGIAVTMHVIGNRSLLPFFFLGYFLTVIVKSLSTAISTIATELGVTASFSVTTVTWAIIGVIIALVYTMFMSKKEEA